MLGFFEWCEQTGVAQGIQQSTWLFPVIEAFHLIALGLFGGTVLLVNLRLLRLVLSDYPVADLARDARPWFLGSLVVMIVSGALLFVSEAVKCYYSFPFWVKMTSLLLAIIFTFTVHRRVTLGDSRRLMQGVAACISLVLWSAVAWGGRWIGFSG